jgi:hypothetical protein
VLTVSRGKCTFKQSDVTRALKATKAAGFDVSKIEIDRDGRLVVVLSDKKADTNDDNGNGNPWDNAI